MYDIKQIKQFKYFNASYNNEHLLNGDDKGRENGSQGRS